MAIGSTAMLSNDHVVLVKAIVIIIQSAQGSLLVVVIIAHGTKLLIAVMTQVHKIWSMLWLGWF